MATIPAAFEPITETTLPPDPGGVKRYVALDALRGVAAMTVVLLHFQQMWWPDNPRSLPGLERHLMMLVQPLYAGHAAVMLFFVLSGFVLALPVVRGRTSAYPRFLLRRIIRIYMPYWCALALAVTAAHFWYPHMWHGLWASKIWDLPVDLHLVLQHILLIGSFNVNEYDFVVWSLVHEMRISILFPFLCVAVVRSGWKRSLAAAALCSLLSLVLRRYMATPLVTYAETLNYIAMFIFGICMAVHMQAIEQWWHGTGRTFRRVLLAAAIVVYGYAYLVVELCREKVEKDHLGAHLPFHMALGYPDYQVAADWITATGACVLLMMAILYRPVKAMLESRAAEFLGRTSYSLYLIHPVVLFCITFLFAGRLGWAMQFVLYVPASVLCGWLLWRGVELQSIALGRRVG